MMKKIFTAILFLSNIVFYSQDMERYNRILSEIDMIEAKIGLYSKANYKKINIPEDLIKHFREDGDDEKDLSLFIDNYKKSQLRERFFNENPKYLKVFEQLNIRDLDPDPCVNPGFELLGGSTFSYSFFKHQYGAPLVFSACIMDINTTIPITPGSLNSMADDVALVSSGYDPVLAPLGVNLCRTNTGCNSLSGKAIRLNRNVGGFDIITMRKNVKITEDFFVFNFASVMNSGHQDNLIKQPFFQVKIFDENGSLFLERCIVADENDCIFIDATPKWKENKILYSNWACIKLSTTELVGQWVDIEFSIADCGQSGHYGYIYIDDLCQESCDSAFGYIDLFPLEEGGECPEFSIEVCGEFTPPMVGTPQEGELYTILLEIFQDNTIVGTVTDVTITGNNFCFNVEESDFTVPVIGDFEFTVTAKFEMNCNIEPYYITLTDTSTNIGPDISCALWPRTYGGEVMAKRYASDIAIDNNDNIYTIGTIWEDDVSYQDTSFLSEGYGFLMKHDSYGRLIWDYYFSDTVIAPQENENFIKIYNNRIFGITNQGYLIGFSSNGSPAFASYQITNSVGTNRIKFDVNENTGEIYVTTVFTSSFSNTLHSVSVSPGEVKVGFFIFAYFSGGLILINEEYVSADALTIKLLGATYSESLNRLFVSGRVKNGTLYFPSDSISDYFGVEYNRVSSPSVSLEFHDVSEFLTEIGEVIYDNFNNRLYVDRITDGVYYMNNSFSGISTFVSSDFERVSDFDFNNNTQEVYVAGKNSFGKIDENGLMWIIDNIAEVGSESIACGSDDLVYVSGNYKQSTYLGDFYIEEYDSEIIDIFIARIQDNGSSGVFKSTFNVKDTKENVVSKSSLFIIYPNPADKHIMIKPKNEAAKIADASFTLFDFSGKEVEVLKNIDFSITQTIEMNLDKLKEGIYILKITSGIGNAEYHKIVKK